MKDKDKERIKWIDEELSVAESEMNNACSEEAYKFALSNYEKLNDEKRKIVKAKQDHKHVVFSDIATIGETVLKHGGTIMLGIGGLALSAWMFKTGMQYEDEGHVYRFQTFKNFLGSSIKRR